MIFRALLPSASSGNAAEALHASNCQRRWKSWLPGPMVFHMFHMPVTSWPLWMVHGCTILYYDVLLLGVRFFFFKPRSSYQSHLAMDQEACRRVPKIEGLNGLRANSGQFAGVQPVGLPATSWRALDSGPHSQESGKILVTSISSIPKVVLSPRLASRSSIVSPLLLLLIARLGGSSRRSCKPCSGITTPKLPRGGP